MHSVWDAGTSVGWATLDAPRCVWGAQRCAGRAQGRPARPYLEAGAKKFRALRAACRRRGLLADARGMEPALGGLLGGGAGVGGASVPLLGQSGFRREKCAGPGPTSEFDFLSLHGKIFCRFAITNPASRHAGDRSSQVFAPLTRAAGASAPVPRTGSRPTPAAPPRRGRSRCRAAAATSPPCRPSARCTCMQAEPTPQRAPAVSRQPRQSQRQERRGGRGRTSCAAPPGCRCSRACRA